MSDPERLLDEGATSLELELLRAGDAEGPSEHAQRATLAALGLGGAVLASSSTATASATATGARLILGKWASAGAVAAAALAGGAGYWALSAPQSSSNSPAVSAPSRPANAPAMAAKPAAPEEQTATPPADDAQRELPSRTGPSERTPAPATSSTSLQDQIALIDRARTAAAAGNPAGTLAALDEYARRFPKGSLYQEAMMLRIEALQARGDKASAAALGRRFLLDHPRSALAPRVRQLLGEAPAER